MRMPKIRATTINQLIALAIEAITPESLGLNDLNQFEQPAKPSDEVHWPYDKEIRKRYRHIWVLTRHRVLEAACTVPSTEWEQAVAIDKVRSLVLGRYDLVPCEDDRPGELILSDEDIPNLLNSGIDGTSCVSQDATRETAVYLF